MSFVKTNRYNIHAEQRYPPDCHSYDTKATPPSMPTTVASVKCTGCKARVTGNAVVYPAKIGFAKNIAHENCYKCFNCGSPLLNSPARYAKEEPVVLCTDCSYGSYGVKCSNVGGCDQIIKATSCVTISSVEHGRVKRCMCEACGACRSCDAKITPGSLSFSEVNGGLYCHRCVYEACADTQTQPKTVYVGTMTRKLPEPIAAFHVIKDVPLVAQAHSHDRQEGEAHSGAPDAERKAARASTSSGDNVSVTSFVSDDNDLNTFDETRSDEALVKHGRRSLPLFGRYKCPSTGCVYRLLTRKSLTTHLNTCSQRSLEERFAKNATVLDRLNRWAHQKASYTCILLNALIRFLS